MNKPLDILEASAIPENLKLIEYQARINMSYHDIRYTHISASGIVDAPQTQLRHPNPASQSGIVAAMRALGDQCRLLAPDLRELATPTDIEISLDGILVHFGVIPFGRTPLPSRIAARRLEQALLAIRDITPKRRNTSFGITMNDQVLSVPAASHIDAMIRIHILAGRALSEPIDPSLLQGILDENLADDLAAEASIKMMTKDRQRGDRSDRDPGTPRALWRMHAAAPFTGQSR